MVGIARAQNAAGEGEVGNIVSIRFERDDARVRSQHRHTERRLSSICTDVDQERLGTQVTDEKQVTIVDDSCVVPKQYDHPSEGIVRGWPERTGQSVSEAKRHHSMRPCRSQSGPRCFTGRPKERHSIGSDIALVPRFPARKDLTSTSVQGGLWAGTMARCPRHCRSCCPEDECLRRLNLHFYLP